MDSRKYEVLDQALHHVPFEGWSDEAIYKALDDLGHERITKDIIYKKGIIEPVTLYIERINNSFLEQLDDNDLNDMKIREKIAHMVKSHILMSNKEICHKTIRFFMQPSYMQHSFKITWKIADMIWHRAGDTATDINHYSKRIILSILYILTIAYYLNDTSEQHQRTWLFLNKRIANIINMGKCKTQYKRYIKRIPFIRKVFFNRHYKKLRTLFGL